MPRIINSKLIFPELSYIICGLCYKIHNKLGRYKNEKQYADAFENILKENKICFSREIALDKSFDGEKDRRNIPDFIVQDKIIIDLKAKRIITKEDYYQMKRYLDASNKQLGLIVNFRQNYLSPKRVLNPIRSIRINS